MQALLPLTRNSPTTGITKSESRLSLGKLVNFVFYIIMLLCYCMLCITCVVCYTLQYITHCALHIMHYILCITYYTLLCFTHCMTHRTPSPLELMHHTIQNDQLDARIHDIHSILDHHRNRSTRGTHIQPSTSRPRQ